MNIKFNKIFVIFGLSVSILLSGCTSDGKFGINKFKHQTPLIKDDIKKKGKIEVDKTAEMGPKPAIADVIKLGKRKQISSQKQRNYLLISDDYKLLKQNVSFKFQNLDYKSAMELMAKAGEINILIGDDGFICNRTCSAIRTEKPRDEIRIFILGGSSVAGHGVDDGNSTISGQLEQMLLSSDVFLGKNIRVINAGIGEAYSAQEAGLLLHKISIYDPDFIISFNGYNDYRQWEYSSFYPFINRYSNYIRPNLHSYDYTVIEGLERVQRPGGAILHTLNLLAMEFPLFYYTTALAKHLRLKAIVKPRAPSTLPLDPLPPPSPEVMYRTDRNSIVSYIKNIKMMAGIATSLGSRSIHCLQPTLPFRNDSGDVRKKSLVGIENKYIDEPDPIQRINGYFRAAKSEFSKLKKLNSKTSKFCDLTDLFAMTDAQTYTDQIHYSLTGNKLIAKALMDQVLSLSKF